MRPWDLQNTVPVASLGFTRQHPFKKIPGGVMISPIQQKISAWFMHLCPVTIMELPPKDPEDDKDENEDENEEDDEDDGEEEEPAVIREPDEC
jgi:hypothetical protein